MSPLSNKAVCLASLYIEYPFWEGFCCISRKWMLNWWCCCILYHLKEHSSKTRIWVQSQLQISAFLHFLTAIHQNLCRGGPWRHHAASRPHRRWSLESTLGQSSKGFTKESKQICTSWFKIQPFYHHPIIPAYGMDTSTSWDSFQAARLPPIPPNSRPAGRSLSKHRAQIFQINRCNFLSKSREAPCPWRPTCKLMVLLSESPHFSLSRIFTALKEWQHWNRLFEAVSVASTAARKQPANTKPFPARGLWAPNAGLPKNMQMERNQGPTKRYKSSCVIFKSESASYRHCSPCSCCINWVLWILKQDSVRASPFFWTVASFESLGFLFPWLLLTLIPRELLTIHRKFSNWYNLTLL